MIAFEVAFLIFLAVVLVVGIKSIAAPFMTAYVEKTRYKYREMGSQAETLLKQRVEYLENEVLALKQQLIEVQQSVDFAIEQNTALPEDKVMPAPKRQSQSNS